MGVSGTGQGWVRVGGAGLGESGWGWAGLGGSGWGLARWARLGHCTYVGHPADALGEPALSLFSPRADSLTTVHSLTNNTNSKYVWQPCC